MADSFFGFDTSLSRDEECPGDLEDLDHDEQEYDALNDETFGDDNETSAGPLDDWEAQHEQLAEIAESSKKNHTLEESLNKLVDDDLINASSNQNNVDIWANIVKPPDVTQTSTPHTSSRNKDLSNSASMLIKSLPENHINSVFNQQKNGGLTNGLTLPKNVCTVEELERGLLTNRNNEVPPKPSFLPNFMPPNHQMQPPPRFPPGLNSMLLNPPYMPPPGLGAQHSPNIFRFVTPHPLLMQHGVSSSAHNMSTGVPRPSINIRPNMGGIHQKNTLLPNRNFPLPNTNFKNFRPDFHTQSFQPYNHIRPPFHQENNAAFLQQNAGHQQGQRPGGLNANNRNNNYPQHNNPHQQQMQQQQNQRGEPENKDEYAGLMTNREKQWLINIQLLQLNTGTPYFDDFYYTVFVDRQNKLEKENRPTTKQDQHSKNNRYQNHNRHQNHRKDDYNKDDRNHRDRDNNPTQIHRTYTPLQFENSLGKLQCGSVTAPRKIIDMDVVSHDKETESNQLSLSMQRDVRKTKQTLLELETLFGLVLRLEDLNNPLAIANTLKLREIKEKQKIQQLETATVEEKEEILKQLQDDSLVKNDNKEDLLNKIFNGVLNDDKFSGYVGVRKGKVLLLRLLPHLCKNYADKYLEIWMKLLASIPVAGKKDQLTDNILPQFFHFFDRFVDQLNMDSILKLTSVLTDIIKEENARLISPEKSSLGLVLCNKFGISCITKLIERSETLFATLQVNEAMEQYHQWYHFLSLISKVIQSVELKMDMPMQPLENCVMETHLKRSRIIAPDQYSIFLNVFCIKHTA
ncbi:protein PAT1 homolog 1 [Chrysoperla carnea]|uniref:protein PAT1 homolog 1 n=1 Tax=Chrysoperla carnea TaxID=189513 RepID=UPI001D08402A|nr:protein PAT1 homolog 1 [Chrysoperla carnea]